MLLTLSGEVLSKSSTVLSVIPRGVPIPHSKAITILRQAREM